MMWKNVIRYYTQGRFLTHHALGCDSASWVIASLHYDVPTLRFIRSAQLADYMTTSQLKRASNDFTIVHEICERFVHLSVSALQITSTTLLPSHCRCSGLSGMLGRSPCDAQMWLSGPTIYALWTREGRALGVVRHFGAAYSVVRRSTTYFHQPWIGVPARNLAICELVPQHIFNHLHPVDATFVALWLKQF